MFSYSGTLPTGVIFTDNHNGTATLSGAVKAGPVGSYSGITVTANNSPAGSISQASLPVTLNVASSATHLSITTASSNTTAGQQTTVTVSALNAANQVDTLFADSVQISTSDLQGTIGGASSVVGSRADVAVTKVDTPVNADIFAYGESFVPTVSGGLSQFNVLDIADLEDHQGDFLSSADVTLKIYQGGINLDKIRSATGSPWGRVGSQDFTLTGGNNNVIFSMPPQLTAGQTYCWQVVAPDGCIGSIPSSPTTIPIPKVILAAPGFGYDVPFQTFMTPPNTYTFQPGDNGTKTFTVTLNTAGTQTLPPRTSPALPSRARVPESLSALPPPPVC